ncbi:hypothetical protein VDF76_05585 [Xanthomonas campestris pv. raphani]|uniref:hypothetical protein n=1 Tax=Xanthomonas campestris TaxID=339 RepID=UPI002B232262|nr:hypothetical protein [Xanthomonas campestris]MEA9746510.1 hypothetical protein [Xanthomonas campestris pv. raphani]MEA9846694.1 hypothetical protein [Xanthomonas campestris pv. raphani]MEA9927587.1 hypothetical protein [Xanthomonas campestris pv. raphani]
MTSHAKVLQLDVLGSFDFYNFGITLDAIESTEFERLRYLLDPVIRNRALTLEQFHALERVIPLIAHELTHFIDATSTCWGMRHLEVLDNAFRAHRLQKEKDFHYLKAASDHVRMLRLPRYYTVVNETDAKVIRPWTYQVTIGLRFTASGSIEGAVPIVFCRFGTLSGQTLARSPLSTVSLLETSAMSQELVQRFSLLTAVQGPDGIVEKHHQASKTLEYLYNHRITEYSACAHLIANHQQCIDVIRAYRLGGRLSRLVLNVPIRSFVEMADAQRLAAIFGADPEHDYIQRIHQGLLQCDVGMLYRVLCAAIPENSFNTEDAATIGIDTALARLGTSMSRIKRLAQDEITAITAKVAQSPSEVLRRLSGAGKQNFKRLSQMGEILRFHELHLPQVLFGDYESRTTFGCEDNLLRDLDLDTCFNELNPLEQAVHNFAEACV